MFVWFLLALVGFWNCSHTTALTVSIHIWMFYIDNGTLMEYAPTPDLYKDQSMQFSGKCNCKYIYLESEKDTDHLSGFFSFFHIGVPLEF